MAKITILIMDDLAYMREALRAVLQITGGFQVVAEAASALEVVQLAEKLTPDVVLMDLELPGLDSFEAVWQIKRRRLAKRVVGLSVNSDNHTRQLATLVGVDAFIEKGTAVQRLIATIRHVFDELSATAT